jgi:hypothetical protein
MRKLTPAQIAAMAASVGFLAQPAVRYGIPLLAITMTAHADSYDDNELEEIVVTGTRPAGPTWDVYIVPWTPAPPTTGGGGTPANPVAQAPTNAQVPMTRNATRCATQFSMAANVNPAGGGGEAPTYSTVYQTGYAWGTNNINAPAQPVITQTNAPPGPGYFRVLGWTSPVQRISYIYTTNIQYDASQRGIAYQSNLVNTLGHEWSHQWNPYYADETEPTRLGNLTQSLYEQAGGMNAPCVTRPVHNGNLGGHK